MPHFFISSIIYRISSKKDRNAQNEGHSEYVFGLINTLKNEKI